MENSTESTHWAVIGSSLDIDEQVLAVYILCVLRTMRLVQLRYLLHALAAGFPASGAPTTGAPTRTPLVAKATTPYMSFLYSDSLLV